MKLEVRDYVRTKKGIAKILGRVNEPDNYYFKMLITDKYLEIHDDTEYIHDLDIIKSSKNIIDLIEEGDYVNGYKVLDILKGFKILVDKLELNTYDGNYYLKQFTNDEIKSIVTKEVFKANEYRMETD